MCPVLIHRLSVLMAINKLPIPGFGVEGHRERALRVIVRFKNRPYRIIRSPQVSYDAVVRVRTEGDLHALVCSIESEIGASSGSSIDMLPE